MNALFFGSSEHPLYGVYHAPKSRSGRRTGVVLCYPFGQEYMRAHRAFRQLSLQLAKAGYHVFRFDYRGTGDSSGDSEAFQLASAVEDTVQAIEEVRDMADVDTVAVFGLRLGGAIAARVAQANVAVTHLVLWDAIANGAAYLEELRAEARVPAGVHGSTDVTFGVMGYPVPPGLQQELASLQFSGAVSPVLPSHAVRTLVVSDSDTADARAFVEWCGSAQWRAESMIAPLPGRWGEVDNWGSAMIPQEAMQSIVTWMSNEVP